LEKISRKNLIVGISLVCLFALASSVVAALVKEVGKETPVGIILFMQSLFSLIFFLPVIIVHSELLRTHQIGKIAIRAVAGLIGMSCIWIAIQHIALVDAILLSRSAPLFMPFIGLIWLKQRIRISVILSMLVGFAGVFVILNPTAHLSDMVGSWYVLLALGGSLFSAIIAFLVRSLTKENAPLTITFYYLLFSTIATSPFLFLEESGSFSNTQWLLFIGMGFAFLTMQLALAQACKHAPPNILGPFYYLAIPFTTILEWVFWNHLPGLLSIIGFILIICGGILIILQQHRVNQQI